VDDIEREAIRDEGYDPDDPAVVAALDRVRDELAAVRPGCAARRTESCPPIGPVDELLDERPDRLSAQATRITPASGLARQPGQ